MVVIEKNAKKLRKQNKSSAISFVVRLALCLSAYFCCEFFVTSTSLPSLHVMHTWKCAVHSVLSIHTTAAALAQGAKLNNSNRK